MKYPTHALRRSRLALNKPTAPQNGALEQCRRYTQGTLRGHIHGTAIQVCQATMSSLCSCG